MLQRKEKRSEEKKERSSAARGMFYDPPPSSISARLSCSSRSVATGINSCLGLLFDAMRCDDGLSKKIYSFTRADGEERAGPGPGVLSEEGRWSAGGFIKSSVRFPT